MIDTAITSSSGLSAHCPIISVNMSAVPANARKRVKMTAPMPTKNSCAVVEIESLRASMNPSRLNWRCSTPMIAARNAPTAPPSVGVTTPA